MISGNTVEILRRNVPHYHTVAADVANRSLSVCVCRDCAFKTGKFCEKVKGKLDDDGLSIVAWNGTCDRVQRKRANVQEPFVLQ